MVVLCSSYERNFNTLMNDTRFHSLYSVFAKDFSYYSVDFRDFIVRFCRGIHFLFSFRDLDFIKGVKLWIASSFMILVSYCGFFELLAFTIIAVGGRNPNLWVHFKKSNKKSEQTGHFPGKPTYVNNYYLPFHPN